MDIPCISSNILISELPDGKFSVFNRISKKTFFIGTVEHFVLVNLDGIKDLEHLNKICPQLSKSDLSSLISRFGKIGFLKGTEGKKKSSITRITLGLFNPNKIFHENSIFVRVFSFIVLYLAIPILIVGILLNKEFLPSYGLLIMESFSLYTIIVIVIITINMLFLHEISHVIVARRYGVNVPELGIILYWFMPGAFVNLSNTCALKSVLKRIKIFSAGIFFNLLISGISLCICCFIDENLKFYFIWLAIDNFFNAIFNLFIFLKMDGYLILKEIIEEEYLRERSISYIKSVIATFLSKRTAKLKEGLEFYNYVDLKAGSATKKAVYITYGIFAFLYIPILLLSFLVTLLYSLI
ncbi:site-2 protease family protein [Clostridium grantii]|uniref:Peptidase family M50 n=1 Tax=Clostridium grantii DSM 8605 TaxID=1121316 RepID=A0A1M5VGC6_9CLOT|nr:site-2 protease family protein [Clostridium grantii]SHH74154.1 Peptidase family M50 [Clostridium grantii DSM 8605]